MIPPRKKRWLRLSLPITILAICILLAGLTLPPLFRELRRFEQQAQCANNLRAISLALHNYQNYWGAFPPAITYADDGTPMHSWRVLIVPYLVQNPLSDAYERQEAWNGPSNRLLADEIPDAWGLKPGTCVLDADYFFFRCPTAQASQGRMITNYVMLIDDRPGHPNGPPNLPGSAPPRQDPKSTVWVIEIADSDVHWMEPRDVLLSELSLKINDRTRCSLSSYHGVVCIARADGSVEMLDESVTAEHLMELLEQ